MYLVKNENKYILEMCKGELANKEELIQLMNEKMDYPYILGQLLYNRIGAIAYLTLKQNELLQKVNREFRNTLRAIYEYNSVKTDSFIKVNESFLSVCREIRFPYAFLKGAYLVELYPHGLRTSNDIDILIEPGNITELTNILKKHGFQQGNIRNEIFVPSGRKEIVSSRMNRGETVPFVKEINYPGMKYLEVDVNFSLGFRPGMDESIVRNFLNHTQPLILTEISTLDDTDFLLHLCAHLYKEATVLSWVEMGRDISLYKYCDIYVYLNQYMNDAYATKLVRRVKEVGLHKECYYTLYYAKELFCIQNQFVDKVLEKIRPDDLSFMNQVFDPQNRIIYSFDINYKDWVFCCDRKGLLYET